MKRFLSLVLAFVFIFSLVSCTKKQDTESEISEESIDNSTESTMESTGATETGITDTSVPGSSNSTKTTVSYNSQETQGQASDTEPGSSVPTVMQYTSYFPKAQQATLLYQVVNPGSDVMITTTTLQGQLAKKGTEQILITDSTVNSFSDIIKNDYGVTYESSDTWQLLKKYANEFSGYILCEKGTESVNVATSLCSQLNAVAVIKDYEQEAVDCGLNMVLDVSGKDDEWLMQSDYFQNLSRKIAINCSCKDGYQGLRDYAVLTDAFVYTFESITSAEKHKQVLDYLDDNAIVFGNFVVNEWVCTKSVSQINCQFVVSYAATNVSTLSGFMLDEVKQKTAQSTEEVPTSNRHTVCLFLTDGDNLQFALQNYPTIDGNWFGSLNRTNSSKSIPFGWGLPPCLIDLAAPATKYYYNNMTEKDEFILQISGMGYNFPSQWGSKSSLRNMAEELNTVMYRMDTGILGMIDDSAFNDANVKNTYNIFTEQSNLKALFYINYAGYATYRGKIAWSNDKPIIAVKYALWKDYDQAEQGSDCDGSIEQIAAKINAASTDPSSPDAYSLVAVFAWSGLKGGQLVGDGDSYKAAISLASKLNENVDVVTPSEFVRRITTNGPGK